MISFIVMILAQGILTIITYGYLRWKILQSIKVEDIYKQEMEALITAFNRNAYDNISVIESRIEKAKFYMEKLKEIEKTIEEKILEEKNLIRKNEITPRVTKVKGEVSRLEEYLDGSKDNTRKKNTKRALNKGILKKTISDRIIELKNKGYEDRKIAYELKMSIDEIYFYSKKKDYLSSNLIRG